MTWVSPEHSGEMQNTIRCSIHGESLRTFVCTHAPHLGDLRPTAVAAVLLILQFLPPALAQKTPPNAPNVIVFVHVNVVPMDTNRVLRNQDVLVVDGAIKEIGEGIHVPEGAQVIDGHGTDYLSPGLSDMHVHSDTRRDMAVYLANGVTTILNMGHARAGFVDSTRPAVDRGEIPGPHIYLAFMVDGSPQYNEFFVKSADEARAVVQLAKTNGYDFIKVYNNLSPDCFYALVQEGLKKGLPVVGHGVSQVGLQKQLAAGQVLVAHAEEYFYTVFNPPGSGPENAPPRMDQVPAAIAFTKQYGAYVTADLITYATIARQWGKPDVLPEFLKAPQVRYLDPDDRIGWRNSGYVKRAGDISARAEFLKKFIRALNEAGVPLVAGTDAPGIPGLVPGFSLHQDLKALEQAGLSSFDVLSTATRVPGEFIQKAKPGTQPFGTIVAGNRADLILSRANPLDDLSTLETPLGVMANGHWHDASDLQNLLAGVAEQYDMATAGCCPLPAR